MHSATVLLALLATFADAHNDPREVFAGLPNLVGGAKFMASLNARNAFSGLARSAVREGASLAAEAHIEARVTDTCGPGVGSCDPGYCCSPGGYCGTTEDYCAGPDCQFQYGPACDANTVPAGPPTSSIPRPKIGSIPYGGADTAGIQDCIKLGVIAFSFDDGPYLYTKDLLDLLDSYGAKATFFITGNNLGKGEIDDCNTGYPQLIKRMYNSGHQVASHTWTHQNLTTLTTAQFQNQIYYNEMALRNILGVIPTYMRPPYSSCDTTCSNQLDSMGYHVTYFDLDTEGYLNDSPDLIQNSKNIFTNALNGVVPSQNDYLLIEHDIHYQTVYNLTKFMLDSMAAAGWGAPVTVGQCLEDPASNWYRSAGSAIATCAAGTYTGVVSTAGGTTASKSTTKPVASTTATGGKTISTDGSCGGTITCQGSTFGNCCSQYGYCGSTAAYCSTGCQPAFGTCSISAPASTSSKAAQTSSASLKPSTTTTSTSKHSTSSPKTTTTSSPMAVSTDGTCAGAGKITCQGSTFGNCCSQYSWCGSTGAYCGTGCQHGFGTCS